MQISMEKLQQLFEEASQKSSEGKSADYIPALAKVDASIFTVHFLSEQNEQLQLGTFEGNFTLQSVVKVISFIVATKHHGIKEIIQYVDVEPTGDSFNSIVRLESDQKKPFNPMINPGAITVASLLPGNSPTEKVKAVTLFLEGILERPVKVNKEVFLSEYHSADYNRAIAYILQANGYLYTNAEDALQTYLQLCSIEVTVSDLAKIALYLAVDGKEGRVSDCVACDSAVIKIAKALMLTCGMYNASGRFAAFVGIPAKSGVSGAILAVVKDGEIEHLKGAIGIGIYGPAIDEVGNSVAGIEFLMKLSKRYDLFCL